MREHNENGETEAAQQKTCSVIVLLTCGVISGIVLVGAIIALRVILVQQQNGTST